jgi:virginiamycin B lyase
VDVWASDVSRPQRIAVGPDGALWFTNSIRASIGRFDPVSTSTRHYSDPRFKAPYGVVSGPDGALWFTDQTDSAGAHGSIGRVTTSGTFSRFSDPSIEHPNDIVIGPDDALWFTNRSANEVGRVALDGTISHFPYTAATTGAFGLASGPDGALWIATGGPVLRMTTGGVVTRTVPVSGGAYEITTGPDGNLWTVGFNAVARIAPAGGVDPFTSSFFSGRDITSGPDGALWFTGDRHVGRVTTAGVISLFDVPDDPGGIASGPGGALWITTPFRIDSVSVSGAVTSRAVPSISNPSSITAGSGPFMWFTNAGSDGWIGTAATSGSIGHVATAGDALPRAIVTGPDMRAWYVRGSHSLVRTGSPAKEFTDPAISAPDRLIVGPDGAFWMNARGAHWVTRVTPDGVVSKFSVPYEVRGLAAGPDGAVWFTAGPWIGRVTSSGAVSVFGEPKGATPSGIAAGADGAMWVVEHHAIARVTTAGVVTRFAAPRVDSGDAIASGTDGAVWFTELGRIARMTTDGVLSEYADDAIVHPTSIAPGQDGRMWFTDVDAIGRISSPIGPRWPRVSVAKASIVEGTGWSHEVRLAVTLSRPPVTPVTVGTQITAVSSAKYFDLLGGEGVALRFIPGRTSVSFGIPIAPDDDREPDEFFVVKLVGPSGARLGSEFSRVTILDDDPTPPGSAIDVSDAAVVEGDLGKRTVRFTLSSSAPRSTPTTVHYVVAAGSAAAGSDVVAHSGVATIPAGRTWTEIPVGVLGDTVVEPTERFTVWLFDPSAGRIGRAVGTGTIIDDDGG